MADRRLLDYVKKSLDSGAPPEKIRAELYRAGWQKNDIEEALYSAGAFPQSAPPMQPARSSASKADKGGRRKIFLIGIIIAVIGGVAVYYLVSSYPLPNTIPLQASPDECGDGKCTGQETYELCPQDCPAPPVNNNIKVALNPPSAAVSSGQTVNFDVNIESIYDLYGFQFDVNYSPGMLQFSKATQGTFLSKNGADSVFCIDPKVSSSGGRNYVTVACTRLGPIGGVSGSGILETLTFTGAGSGTAQPEVSNIKLVDSSAKRISF